MSGDNQARHEPKWCGSSHRNTGRTHGLRRTKQVPEAGALSFANNGWLRPVAEGERSEGRGGGLRRRSTRNHEAQAARNATIGA